MSRVLVVAEPGCTHGGSLDKMRELIRMSADCGADGFKPQWVSSPERLCERRRAPEHLEAYRLIAFPLEWHETLRKDCEAVGVQYGCTCYLPEDVAVAVQYVAFHKIASFEAGNRAFLEAHRSLSKPVYASTGMMGWPQVRALAAWLWTNRQRKDDAILHCVSAYPCPVDQANIAALTDLKIAATNLRLGYSDHTGAALTGAVAVARGAEIVEVHVRLDDADPSNPDHPHALTPGKLKQYVENVRLAETAMGDGVKRAMPCEEAMRRYRVGG